MSERENVIDNLRALIGRATPGPWATKDRYVMYGRNIEPQPVIASCRFDNQYFPLVHTRAEANAALIVAAVNALPGLLDELSTLRARVAEVEREAGKRMNPQWAASYLYIHGYLTERERDVCRKRIEGERHE